MANKQKYFQQLARAIPATSNVQDFEAKRVLDAMSEILKKLLTASIDNDTAAAPDRMLTLIAGENVTIETLPNDVRRISSQDKDSTTIYDGAGSVVVDNFEITLDGDEATPDAGKVYGTDPTTGAKGWVAAVSEPEDPGAAVVTIGDATEGAEAAEGTTWTYAGTNGLKLYAMTRAAYYDAGDETVYGYVRLLTFDKYGRLYSIGAETRISIDVTVPES